MNIGKFGALWSLVTGGWAGLAAYILEAVNKWLATLDQSKLAEVAKIVKAIASALAILLNTFLPEKFRPAAQKTLDALNTLVASLEDGKITQEELDANIDAVEAAVKAWKDIK